jgi:hypothetical protein
MKESQTLSRLMSTKTKKTPKRTRSHIIADLSENHFMRFILKEGHTCESTKSDYGYDLILSTFSNKGEFENGSISIQLKATDKLRLINQASTISFTIKRKHYTLWKREPMPVILVVFDSVKERAFWLYFQDYLENKLTRKIKKNAASITVNIPIRNKLNRRSVKKLQTFKNNVLKQIDGKIIHHA